MILGTVPRIMLRSFDKLRTGGAQHDNFNTRQSQLIRKMNFLKSILRIIRTVILSLLLVCIVIFMVNNREAVTIHLYPLPFDVETRIFVVMIIVFLLGLLFGILSCSQSLIKRIFANLNDRRKIRKLEKQVTKN
jgi:uncharacterized integral membrane protein